MESPFDLEHLPSTTIHIIILVPWRRMYCLKTIQGLTVNNIFIVNILTFGLLIINILTSMEDPIMTEEQNVNIVELEDVK